MRLQMSRNEAANCPFEESQPLGMPFNVSDLYEARYNGSNCRILKTPPKKRYSCLNAPTPPNASS